MNQYQNQMNYNNTNQVNQLNIRNKGKYYQINNNQQNFTNVNNNLYSYDKRLALCLKYLGLNKYVPNFIKRGIRFEDFLSFSNNDLASFKIPPNIQHIIQKFILAYFNFGSLYTIEEIIQFFKTRRVKKFYPRNSELNANERNRERNNNNVKYKSVNQKNNNNSNYNFKQNSNFNNNIIYQRNLNSNINNAKKRPKSQNNKLISDPNDYTNYNNTPNNNVKQKILTNNNCVFKLNLLDYKNNNSNNSQSQYKSILINQKEIDYIKNFISRESTEKIALLSSPLNQNLWFRGKIKKIKLQNNEIYQYFNDNYEIILMSAIKKNRKSFKIFSEEQFLKKIGSIKVNILGNKYKIKMEKNIQNKCKVKYV